MINRNRLLTLLLVGACIATLSLAVSCSGNESKAKSAIREYLKSQAVTDLTLDLFYADPNSSDRAYASATATYSFSGSEGKPKREFLGFILAREGSGWRVDRNVSYTKEDQKAATYLAGGK